MGKPVIGILGGIGAGKSTAAGLFVELGCALVDADAIGHELLAAPDVQRELRGRWGAGVFAGDGGVDRAKLGRIVFADAAELAALNRIVHPRIGARLAERIAAAAVADPAVKAVVLDAAVMVEAGWDELCSHLVFVDAPPALRRQRARAGKGWDAAEWRKREKSQIPVDTKAGECYHTIDNSSSVCHLREQIRRFFTQILPEVNEA